jgi:hypothetical protein
MSNVTPAGSPGGPRAEAVQQNQAEQQAEQAAEQAAVNEMVRKAVSKAFERFEGTGSSADAGDGKLSDKELSNAGVTHEKNVKYIQNQFGGDDKQVSADELGKGVKNGFIQIADDGTVSVTESGQKASDEWNSSLQQSQLPGKAVKLSDADNSGSLDVNELEKAGVMHAANREYLVQKYGGKDQALTAAELDKARDTGELTINDQAKMGVTELGQRRSDMYNEAQRQETSEAMEALDTNHSTTLGNDELKLAGLVRKQDRGFLLEELGGKDKQLSGAELLEAQDRGLIDVNSTGEVIAMTAKGREEADAWQAVDAKKPALAIERHDAGKKDGSLSDSELQAAGLTSAGHREFLRSTVAGDDGIVNQKELAEAKEGGLVEISDDGQITLSDQGQKQADAYNNAQSKKADQALSTWDGTGAEAEDGSLGAKELSNAGVGIAQNRDFLQQVLGGEDKMLNKAELVSAQDRGLIEVTSEGDIRLTEKGQQASNDWAKPEAEAAVEPKTDAKKEVASYADNTNAAITKHDVGVGGERFAENNKLGHLELQRAGLDEKAAKQLIAEHGGDDFMLDAAELEKLQEQELIRISNEGDIALANTAKA